MSTLQQKAPIPDGQTALYRWFDAADELLYVGITNNVAARQDSHTAWSSWVEFAVRSTIERFPARAEAEDAEVAAIRAERPLFNRQHNDTPEAERRLVEYLVRQGRLDLLAPAVKRRRPSKPAAPTIDPTQLAHRLGLTLYQREAAIAAGAIPARDRPDSCWSAKVVDELAPRADEIVAAAIDRHDLFGYPQFRDDATSTICAHCGHVHGIQTRCSTHVDCADADCHCDERHPRCVPCPPC